MAFPEVPSTRELGYPGLDIKQWIGAFAPGGTPQEILEQLNSDINGIVLIEDFRKLVRLLDATIQTTTLDEFAAQVDSELVQRKLLAEERGIQAN